MKNSHERGPRPVAPGWSGRLYHIFSPSSIRERHGQLVMPMAWASRAASINLWNPLALPHGATGKSPWRHWTVGSARAVD